MIDQLEISKICAKICIIFKYVFPVMNKISIVTLKKMKQEGRKIVALTCYSYTFARIMVNTDIDIILVGDSLGMVELGYENTLPVTIDEVVHHTKAVKKAAPKALLIADMPFMSFSISNNETLRDASRLIKESGAEAVKIEGGDSVKEVTKFLVDNNIPVMSHLGLTPQAIHKMGGYRVQGKDPKEANKMVDDARILEDAGSFALVLEGIPADLSKKITESVAVPTIGIGAGPYCDGQILVVNDILGLNKDFKPKFVRRYIELESMIYEAFNKYSKDVRNADFPTQDESY